MSRRLSPWTVLLAFLVIAGFFLFSEHRAHAFGVVPYLLLLACPLLHFFMHRGHGRHDAHKDGARDELGRENPPRSSRAGAAAGEPKP